MSNPLVSVIIPAYNAEGQIASALESVFGQTYRPIEVIVIDDGSTDRTAEIVKNYVQGLQIIRDEGNDRMIRTSPTSEAIELKYIYQQNSGPSKARNTGIKATKGEYIALLDADDIWTRNKLKRQMELFKRDPQIDFVFTNAIVTRLDNNRVHKTIMFQRNQLNTDFFGHDYMVINSFEKLLRSNFITTSSVVAKTACFSADYLFNETRRLAEDWELWLKMSLSFNFAYIYDQCVQKRKRGDSLSSDKLKMHLSAIDALDALIIKDKRVAARCKNNNALSKFIKNRYKWAGYSLLEKKCNKLARTYFIKALKQQFDFKALLYYLKSFLN